MCRIRTLITLLIVYSFVLCLTPTQGSYSEALDDSLFFYEAQRSGKLPPDNRVDFRGDSAMNDSYKGKDLTGWVHTHRQESSPPSPCVSSTVPPHPHPPGGYYDAGDYLKITYPLCFSLTQLAWGMLEFADGYEAANQTQQAQQTLQWGLDWLLKAHIGDDTLVVLVGDVDKEHGSWTRIESMTIPRPAFVV